jgi:rRNA-processing protein FCF1
VTVVFDTNMTVMLVRPNAMVARDDKGQPVSHAKERVDGLVSQLAADKNKIVIPANVLAELLIRSEPDDRDALIARFARSAHFRVADFDMRAAIELADIERKAIGGKRDGVQGSWTKVRFDRQIIAVAVVVGADTIYTDDADLAKHAFKRGIKTVGIGALPIPSAAAQMPLDLEPRRRMIDLGDNAEEPASGA